MRNLIKLEGAEQRLLSYKEAKSYLGVGESSLRKLANEIPCTKRIGKRVLFDKVALDKYIDQENK